MGLILLNVNVKVGILVTKAIILIQLKGRQSTKHYIITFLLRTWNVEVAYNLISSLADGYSVNYEPHSIGGFLLTAII